MQITPELIILGVMLAGLILYVLLGGADYGGGMWDLLAFGPRARRQREAIASAIGPVWEANHVWLILVVVLLFSAFPPAFAAIMTALHIPMTLILIGIVLRGAAFVFRKYDAQDDVVHRRWSTIFGIASFLTPFLLGISLGGLATGAIRVEGDVVLSGFIAGWLTPFAIACGMFTQGMFAFLAATYLTLDTRDDPALQNDFRLRAIVSGASLAPVALAVFWLARYDAPHLFQGLIRPWAPFFLAATSICAIGALVALYRRTFPVARAAAIAQVTLILLGWAFAQFPYLVPADLTYQAAASPRSVLQAMVWALAAGSLVLLPSLYYLFRTFKSRDRATPVAK